MRGDVYDVYDVCLEVRGKGGEGPDGLGAPRGLGDHTALREEPGDTEVGLALPLPEGRAPLGAARRGALPQVREGASGIEDWERIHPHSFRHGFGVALAEQGVSAAVIQKLMGHSSMTTTQIYTDMRPMDAARAMRAARFSPFRIQHREVQAE